jgi:hypothetical protein
MTSLTCHGAGHWPSRVVKGENVRKAQGRKEVDSKKAIMMVSCLPLLLRCTSGKLLLDAGPPSPIAQQLLHHDLQAAITV